MRNRLYRIGIVLTAIFVADGVLMAAALLASGYYGLGYANIIFLPVFVPAVAVALVVIGFYLYGFARLSWTARRAEWVFFAAFVLALAGKVMVVLTRN